MKRAAATLALLVLLSGPAEPGTASPPVLDAGLRAALRSPYAAEILGIAPESDGPIPCFIEGTVGEAALTAHGASVGTRIGNRFTARVPLSRIEALSRVPGITRIRAARRLEPMLDLSVPDTRANLLRIGLPDTAQGLVGQNVLIGVVDTGADWSHPDFKDGGGATRITALWDQTDAVGPPPSGFSYGSGWTAAQIDLGTCREVDNTFFGHGTHVAGIAAGNGRGTGNAKPPFTYVGIAPRARLAIVKTTFNDTDIVDAVDWIFDTAAALGIPAVVNLSLGGDQGPHDGTTDLELMLNAMSGPGRIVVASGGNSNAKGLHGERIVPSVGEGVVSFRIFAYSPSPSVSEGVSLDGWYQGGDNINVSVRSPLGTTVGPVAKGGLLNVSTPEGWVSIDHTGTEASNVNGDVEVAIEISDAGGVPVMSGDWEVRMTGVSLPQGGETDYWIHHHSFPSSPAFVNGKDETELVIEPGTADSVISVAAHTTRTSWLSVNGTTYNFGQTLNQIATFSSVGPRRDGVLKPDLSAPGTAIGSTHSATSQPNPTSNILPDGVHKILQGTSMSAPHVAGGVALLLEKWPALAGRDAKNALTSSARSDGITGSVPNATWGYGRLDMQRLLQSRLAFLVEIDAPHFAHPGGSVYLLDLCAVPQAATWPTRYRMKVSDSKGWLHYENGGSTISVASWSELTTIASAGQRRCIPETGLLLITVPPGTPDGENTLVTFEVEPEKVPFMKQTLTTMVTVGATVASGETPRPSSLELSVAAGRARSEYVFRLALPRSGRVGLILLDVQGRRRVTVWDAPLEAGFSEVNWTGRDAAGRRLESGIYYARLDDGRETTSRPVLVLP